MWSDTEQLCSQVPREKRTVPQNKPEALICEVDPNKRSASIREPPLGRFAAPKADVLVKNQEKLHKF